MSRPSSSFCLGSINANLISDTPGERVGLVASRGFNISSFQLLPVSIRS